MKYKKVIAGLVGCILSATASASLVFQSNIVATGQGFGAAPRNLTIQQTGNSTGPAGTESGCVAVSSGGTIDVGPFGCAADAVIAPNGVIPTGGDEPSPQNDNQKYGIPTLGSLGITNAGQIGILFNATEPSGDSINVTDITLNFFSGTGSHLLLTSIDGQQSFASSFPGNGAAGFVFVVDAAQQAILNTTIFNQVGFGSTILSLNSTLTDVGPGGPESFVIYNRGGGGGTIVEIPEPGTLALLGIALLGGLAASRKRLDRNRNAT